MLCYSQIFSWVFIFFSASHVLRVTGLLGCWGWWYISTSNTQVSPIKKCVRFGQCADRHILFGGPSLGHWVTRYPMELVLQQNVERCQPLPCLGSKTGCQCGPIATRVSWRQSAVKSCCTDLTKLQRRGAYQAGLQILSNQPSYIGHWKCWKAIPRFCCLALSESTAKKVEDVGRPLKQQQSNFSSKFASWPDTGPPPPGGNEQKLKSEKEKSEIKIFPSEIIIPPTSGLSSGFGNIHKYKVGVSLRTFSHRF